MNDILAMTDESSSFQANKESDRVNTSVDKNYSESNLIFNVHIHLNKVS